MAETIRFYVDEHIHGAVVQGLHLRGIDLLTANEADRTGLPDPDQPEFAADQGRVVLTFDSELRPLSAEGTMGRRIRVIKQGHDQ